MSGQRSNAGDGSNSGAGNGKGAGAGATIGQRLFSASPAATFGSAPALKPRVGGGGFPGSAGLGGRSGSSATVCCAFFTPGVELTFFVLGENEQSDAASQEEDLQPVAGRVAAAAAAFSQHRLSTPGGSSPSPPSSGGTQNVRSF